MYYPREDKKLNSFLARDLKRIRICQNYYPSCFVLTAASGTDEPRYPEVDLCQQDRHVIYFWDLVGRIYLQFFQSTIITMKPLCTK